MARFWAVSTDQPTVVSVLGKRPERKIEVSPWQRAKKMQNCGHVFRLQRARGG